MQIFKLNNCECEFDFRCGCIWFIPIFLFVEIAVETHINTARWLYWISGFTRTATVMNRESIFFASLQIKKNKLKKNIKINLKHHQRLTPYSINLLSSTPKWSILISVPHSIFPYSDENTFIYAAHSRYAARNMCIVRIYGWSCWQQETMPRISNISLCSFVLGLE